MDKQNIRSMGDIHLEEGEYGEISCAGDLRFKGRIFAENIKAAGDFTASEDVTTKKISVYGDGEFKGHLTAGEISIYGDAHFRKTVKAEEIRVYGSMQGNRVEGEKITIHGELEKAVEISAEELILHGEFHVESTMNLGFGSLNLIGHSDAGEIFCEKLEIRSGKEDFQGILSGLLGRGKGGTLKVDIIEGDDIYLENTTADVVRGKKVRIGEGSRIRRVEYSDTLEIFNGGQVEEKEEF